MEKKEQKSNKMKNKKNIVINCSISYNASTCYYFFTMGNIFYNIYFIKRVRRSAISIWSYVGKFEASIGLNFEWYFF